MSIGKQATRRPVEDLSGLRTFYPLATIRCEGARVYRSQAARDLGCLLDVDACIKTWSCMPGQLGDTGHAVDFEAVYDDGRVVLLDAHDRDNLVGSEVLESVACASGTLYRRISREDVYAGFRLRNTKDLLRYGNYVVPLSDRLRLLGALDENGSLPISDCLNAFQEIKPVAGLASLILHRYLDVDLDTAPLGPETAVRRITR